MIVCMCVGMFLRMCSMINSMRLKLDLGGGVLHDSLRKVKGGG